MKISGSDAQVWSFIYIAASPCTRLGFLQDIVVNLFVRRRRRELMDHGLFFCGDK
ncbi:transmembrane protein, putative [Medicago truncatula]|uniref:Transmembrane protein, putative n=1 Tax=Medicago truncatula TaxID=3880 RepID=G7KL18_MEDTR|nr:transmembrane protein, putative [Medicago truncatula]